MWQLEIEIGLLLLHFHANALPLAHWDAAARVEEALKVQPIINLFHILSRNSKCFLSSFGDLFLPNFMTVLPNQGRCKSCSLNVFKALGEPRQESVEGP